MEKIKITILCENRAGLSDKIIGEHGFSALLEKGEEKILLDTGQGLGLETNARTLGCNLSEIGTIVFSHGHYDHTGGLPGLLPFSENTRVVAHPDIFSRKYSHNPKNFEQPYRYIGIPVSKKDLEADQHCDLILQKEFIEISCGVFFSGQIQRTTGFENSDSHLKVKTEDGFSEDPLLDDASLLIETRKGPVILTGCAHAGIVNVMKHFQDKTGHKRFYAVIGGTHLGFTSSEDQLEKTMQAFEDFGLDRIAVSHCTGNEAAAACYNRFKSRFAFANAGWTVEV